MSAPAPGRYVGLREPTGAMVTRPDGTPSGDSRDPGRPSSPWRCCSTIPATRSFAIRSYQRFKAAVVASWRGKEWTLEPREIDAWLAVATA